MSFVRRQWDRLRGLWKRALEENASPTKFAQAIALGAFISAAPLYGARTPLAALFAWWLKLNKLTAVLASHILSGPLAWLAILYEMRLGCLILARPVPPLGGSFGAILGQARDMLLSWILGALVVAVPFAVLCGLVAYPISKRYQARRALRLAAEERQKAAEG